MIGLPLMSPMSLPEAMSEPVKVTAPMTTSRTTKTVVETGAPAAPVSLQEVLDRDEGRRAAADRVEERDELRHLRHLDVAGRVEAEAAADDEADDDDHPGDGVHPAVAGHEADQRGQDGHDHAAGGQEVAVPRRGRRVHQVEAQHEADGAAELGEVDEGRDVHRGSPSGLRPRPWGPRASS